MNTASSRENSTLVQTAPGTLHLLGRAELTFGPPGDAAPLRFLPERRFRLLAYVALRGDWVSRDDLANLFWPDRTQEAARSNLRKLLLEVRALDVPQLESDRNGVRWNVGTDVTEFVAAVKRGDPNAALALYRGPALHGLDGGDSEAFSMWLASERARLRTAWHDAAVAVLPQRDPAGVLELTRRLLDDDPYDEDAMVAALDAYGALGDAAAAADAFRGYAEQLIEGLGVEPSARVRAAAARATGPVQDGVALLRRRSTDAPASAASPASAAVALPAASFIGRAQELEELSALLTNPDCRLLTVTGPGGMGKSCLVKQAVRQLEARYADCVTWIGLDDLTEVAQVAPRLASALGIDLAPQQDPVERIVAHLATRHALLVLDNSEHLPRLSTLIERLLAAAPRLQVLTTSRTRIGVAREWLLPLTGLTLPPADGPASEIVAADAVQLFVAHACATDPRFNIDANAPHIATLVRAVGGLPLAILLAASWIRLVPMSELAQEVAQSLDVLERAEEGDERPEHRSVRATFEQSWRLLAPAEQRALAALSVMAGGFSRGAARDVAQAPLPLLASLVDKSLVQVDAQGRFSLHPLIQQFAAEKLGADGDAQATLLQRHAEYFAELLGRHADIRRTLPKCLIAEVGPELPNCRLAWATLVVRRDARRLLLMAAPLKHFLQITGGVDEALRLLAQVEAGPMGNDTTGQLAVATACRLIASALLRAGRMAEAQAKAESALPRCRALGDTDGTKACTNLIGLTLMRVGDDANALPRFEAVLQLAEADGDLATKAVALQNLGILELQAQRLDSAATLLRHALEAHRAVGNVLGEVQTLNSLGNCLRNSGSHDLAVAAYREALQLCDEHGLVTERPLLLMNHAVACLLAGELTQAHSLYSEALAQARRTHLNSTEIGALQGLGRTAVRRGDFTGAVEPLRASLQLARKGEETAQTAEAVCYVAEWLAGQGDRHQAGLLLAHLFRLGRAWSDTITLRSALGLSNDELTAMTAGTATLDLDSVAALALNLLPPPDTPVLTGSAAG